MAQGFMTGMGTICDRWRRTMAAWDSTAVPRSVLYYLGVPGTYEHLRSGAKGTHAPSVL